MNPSEFQDKSDVDDYFDAVRAYTQDIIDSIEGEMELEEKIKEQAQELEQLDQQVINDLKEVLNDFKEYHQSMAVMMMELIELRDKKEGPDTSEEAVMEVMNEFHDGGINMKEDQNPLKVQQVMQEIHDDLKDAFKRMKEKDEDLEDIVKEMQKIETEDRDIEKEVERTEKIVEVMDKMVNEWEADFSNKF
jgi:hypothetical protein